MFSTDRACSGSAIDGIPAARELSGTVLGLDMREGLRDQAGDVPAIIQVRPRIPRAPTTPRLARALSPLRTDRCRRHYW